MKSLEKKQKRESKPIVQLSTSQHKYLDIQAYPISTCFTPLFDFRPKHRQLSTATHTDTVTIPREVLQHLLKKEHLNDYNSLPISLGQPSSPSYITPLDHIEDDRVDESYFQQAASEDDECMMSLHPAAKGTLREFVT